MFINDVNKKDDIRKIAILTLRKLGIKFREKHHRQISQSCKSTRFFKVHLQNIENETITLKNGQQLVIPKQLYEICSFIYGRVETEGIFRKEGSRSRQQEIKLLVDRGCLLEDHHVVDVAVVLKCFLRELPEPLIPYSFHELFLRCSLIENKIEAILLACLLLPTEHLNVLSFLMQFFSEVANHSHFNKMNSCNIATVIGPNVFPISEKIDPKNRIIVTKSCNIIKIMIENSNHIGEIPDYIIEQIGSSGTSEQGVDFKIKRRSGSFTRIFHGLKRIVGNKSDDDILSNTVTPDLLLTPSFPYSTKRCHEGASSEYRTKENHLNKKNGTCKVLNRRWSSVTQSATKRKRRTSLIDISSKDYNDFVNRDVKIKNLSEFLKVSETEYEEIKSRVCKIEKELSRELNMGYGNINNIQTAYEQTLVQSEALSPTTDHLARRLSKELRIRTTEQKMIRSPSARKIGNIKRRSRELDKPNNKIFKSSSFQLSDIKYMNNEISHLPCVKDDKYKGENKFFINVDFERSTSLYSAHKLTNVPCNSTRSFTEKFNKTKFENPNTKGYIVPKNLCSNKSVQASKSTKSLDIPQYKTKHSNSEKSLKLNTTPIKRNISLKQKRKTDKVYVPIKQNIDIKENLMTFTEVSLDDNIKETKSLNKYCSTFVPHIKKSLIVKSPTKRVCTTPMKNTPLKVLSASQCLNTNISF